jgi:hypothetical protein
LIVGEEVIGSIGETEVNDDASVSPSKEDANSDEVVEERDVSESWVIVDTEGSN